MLIMLLVIINGIICLFIHTSYNYVYDARAIAMFHYQYDHRLSSWISIDMRSYLLVSADVPHWVSNVVLCFQNQLVSCTQLHICPCMNDAILLEIWSLPSYCPNASYTSNRNHNWKNRKICEKKKIFATSWFLISFIYNVYRLIWVFLSLFN